MKPQSSWRALIRYLPESPTQEPPFSACKNETVTLALVHEPDYIDRLRKLVPVDLQLSGHTHGGQVRVPGLGAIILPTWGKAYVEGLYRVGASQVYTSRGIGMVGLPFRFNCPPEVTEITLAQGELCGSNRNNASEAAPHTNEV